MPWTRAPAAAKWRAIAFPMPLLAPVTTPVFPCHALTASDDCATARLLGRTLNDPLRSLDHEKISCRNHSESSVRHSAPRRHMPAIQFDTATNDDERRAALYDGDIVVTSRTSSVSEFSAYAAAMAEAAFEPRSPTHAQFELSVEDFSEVLATRNRRDTSRRS
jgi:hypothetical protein